MPMGTDGDGPLSPSVIDMSRNRRASFVSYSRMKGPLPYMSMGLMVGFGQHNTLVQQKLFGWLSNASGPLLVPLR